MQVTSIAWSTGCTSISRLWWTKILCLLLFVQLLSLCSLVKGSHYHKFHMSDFCDPHNPLQITLSPGNMSVVLIKLKRESYKPNMNCAVHLRAPPNYGIMTFITKMKLRRFTANKADRIKFSAYNHTLGIIYGKNQEFIPKEPILTKAGKNHLDIQFISEPYLYSLAGKGFKIVANLYTLANENKCDATLGLEFNCQNNLCIDTLLECDGINNCQNNEDEIECDETSETKLSLYVFLCTIVVMIALIVMFMMKNKDKRKEIVRRMSRVYAHNPILYVMENNTETNSTTNSICQDFPQLNNAKVNMMTRPASIKSKLSLSLPQGIDHLHNNINSDLRII